MFCSFEIVPSKAVLNVPFPLGDLEKLVDPVNLLVEKDPPTAVLDSSVFELFVVDSCDGTVIVVEPIVIDVITFAVVAAIVETTFVITKHIWQNQTTALCLSKYTSKISEKKLHKKSF